MKTDTAFLLRGKIALALLIFLLIGNSSFSQTIGEYRSRTSGNWNIGGSSGTWEQWNGSAWVTQNPTYSPGSVTIPGDGFPVIAGTSTSTKTGTGNGTHVISLPSGIQAGDLILIFYTDADNSGTNPTLSGYTQLATSNSNTSSVYRKIWYKIADGSEGATVSTNSFGDRSAHIVYRIAAGSYIGTPFVSSAANGTDDEPDPGNLAPGQGTQKFLWLASAHAAEVQTFTIPTNFSDDLAAGTTGSSTNSEHCQVITASRFFEGASLNAGNFDLNGNAIHTAWTVAIQGIGIGGVYPHPVLIATDQGVQSSSNVSTHSINIPAGEIGDLLVTVFSTDGNITASTTSTGWSKLGQATNTSGDDVTGAIFWKMAAGITPASDVLNISTSNNERSSHITYRIRGATGISGTSATGSSTNSNPPSHTASEASYLWITTRSGDGTVEATSAPSAYSSLLSVPGGHTDGASTSTAISLLGTAQMLQDPDNFSSANEQWVSWTLAIHGPAQVVTYTPISFPQTIFPVIAAGTATSTQTSTSSSDQVITLPTGITVADLLLVFYADGSTNSTATLPAGWTELYNTANSNRRAIAMYRIADGSETATVTITTSSSERSAHNAYRIAAGTYQGVPVAVSSATGTSTNPDAPSSTPPDGNKSYLWIAASHSSGDDDNPSPSIAGGLYADLLSGYTGSGNSHARMLTATRNFAGTMDNPDAFTLGSSEVWIANTVAIRGSGTTSIQSGNTVIITTSVSVPDITINSGGQVTVNNSVTQTIPTAGTLNVNGTLQMGTNGTAVIDGAGTFTLGTSGTLGVTSTNGITSAACGTGASCGNIRTTARSFSAANYIYNNNSAAQNTGNGLPATINSLTINNSSGVTLSQHVAVSGSASFTSGILTSTASQRLTFNDNATVSGASNTSYVSGKVRKTGNDAFSFPVGNGGLYSPLSISAPDNVADAFEVEYLRQSGNSLGAITSPGLLNVSNCEYWILNEINDAGSATSIDVTTYWFSNSGCNGLDYVTMPTAVSLAHFNGSTWDTHGGAAAGTTTAGSVTRTAVSNFSIFTLGNANEGALLPVTISRIKAYEKQTGIQIDWTAYTEINVRHYEIERSADGRTFTAIGQVAAFNSTSVKDYGFFDANPLPGTNFYRIKNVDNDNKTAYSNIVRISLDKTDKELRLYPNPVNSGYVVFQSADMTRGNYSAKVVNAAGQLLYQLRFTHAGGAISQRIQLPATIKPGLYVLQLDRDAESIISRRFVVQ